MKRLLNFPTDAMPLRQKKSLVHALSTVFDVLSGLQEQPRFTEGQEYNQAGDIIESLRIWIGFEIDHIRDVARKQEVTSRDEADDKFEIIMGDLIFAGETPLSVIAQLAETIADMDWRLDMKGAA